MSGERDSAGAEREERWPIGREIAQNIRRDVNDPEGSYSEYLRDHDPFQELYLRERDCCIPDAFVRGDELLEDIHELFYHVLEGVAHKLASNVPGRESISIAIDPSYQDTTYFVLHTTRDVLLSGSHECWHFWWESEDAMAEELEDGYRGATGRLRAFPARESIPVETERRFLVTLRLERKSASIAPASRTHWSAPKSGGTTRTMPMCSCCLKRSSSLASSPRASATTRRVVPLVRDLTGDLPSY